MKTKQTFLDFRPAPSGYSTPITVPAIEPPNSGELNHWLFPYHPQRKQRGQLEHEYQKIVFHIE